ncbi:MAG: mechanosensitive ion channel [Rhodothermales bacterium]|nr:mechanosensitive ion channel [Rhodothermales bacterium]MBO6779973.1 mechanosensitive ion channel [Rhodothermales bacterium]
MQDASALIEQILVTVGGYIPRAVGAILVLIATFWLSKRMGRAIFRSVEGRLDVTLAKFFGSLTRYGVLTIGILACLRVFGIETTSLAALIGAAGLAVGLALQGTLSNFSSGIMLVLFRPFQVGDVVEVGSTVGKVAGVSLFNTEIDTFDNKRIIVPNGSVFGNTITNYNFHPTRRVDVVVGTAYDADIRTARQVMLDTASAVEGVLEDPAPQVYLDGLGGSSIDWKVRVWVQTPDFWRVKEEVTENVKYALDEADIGIPFPQLDVHLDRLDV